MAKKGSLSISSENIFPVIKKWLYSDHDIFYRELISNGCDAITKLKKLELMGEYEKPEDFEYKIQVTVNPNEKTITFTDNGLGMTEEEVDEYINQIAFSGAQDFLNSIRIRQTKIRSSVTLAWAFILHLWLRTRLPSTAVPIRRTQNRFTGNQKAVRSSRWAKEPGKSRERLSFCI